MRSALFIIIVILVVSVRSLSGQYYNTGQDPSSLKWMQIKTDHFTVIYPEKYGTGGRAFAESLDQAYSKLVTLFPEKRFKIPVVIHSLTTQSNGYVAWAPSRMEIYPTPEQNTIPLDPNTQLAIHELAHVFQLETLNTGFSKAMSVILGEQSTGVVSSLLPLWFFEGDAVFAETALTGSGRGRNPSFQKQIKASAVEDGRFFNYDRSINGSYRDFIPDYYQSGFQMVTWAISKYDPQIWNKVLQFTGGHPFTLNPVNISLTRSAGLKKAKLFKETFDKLKTIWTKEISDDNALTYEAINPPKEGEYLNYYSPVYAGTDSIIAVKTSLTSSASFVLIDPSGKTEKTVHTPGMIYPYFISCAQGKLVWVETEPDPRWENRNYSVIKLKNLRNNYIIRLSRKSRYLSVSISPDGKIIAAIENSISNNNSLVFIDAENGTVRKSVHSPENAFLQRPQWAYDGGKITVISLTGKGEGIMSYSLSADKWETLIEAGKDDLQSTFLRNDSLFFISSRSGTDNIYLRTPEKKIMFLTKSRFGASDLTLKGNSILFSDYTSSGNIVSSTTISGSKDTGSFYNNASSFLINRIDIKHHIPEAGPGNIYTPVPYRKWQHLFRFHSWMPFYADIEQIKSNPATIRPGISIMTQNNLSTLISSIGYEYSSDKRHVFHSRITWNGWYPVIESQLDYGNNTEIYNTGNDGKPKAYPTEIQSGLIFSNTVSVPLSFSSGSFSQFLWPSVASQYNNDYILVKEVYDYGQAIFTGRIYFANYYRSALRDIYPRWAQTIDLNYSYAPFDRAIYGKDISIRTSFYFPGILPNNGIRIRFEKEKQDRAKFLLGNRASFPRGYKYLRSENYNFYSIDYVSPLIYPDFNLSSLLYLKRIRSGFFYDLVSGPGNTFYEPSAHGLVPLFTNTDEKILGSYGFELLADFHILRIPFMISGGVQAAWKTINKKPVFGLLFNIDLYGMTLGKRQL
jgi:hypothetical protein